MKPDVTTVTMGSFHLNAKKDVRIHPGSFINNKMTGSLLTCSSSLNSSSSLFLSSFLLPGFLLISFPASSAACHQPTYHKKLKYLIFLWTSLEGEWRKNKQERTGGRGMTNSFLEWHSNPRYMTGAIRPHRRLISAASPIAFVINLTLSFPWVNTFSAQYCLASQREEDANTRK